MNLPENTVCVEALDIPIGNGRSFQHTWCESWINRVILRNGSVFCSFGEFSRHVQLFGVRGKQKENSETIFGQKKWNLKKHLESVHPEIYGKHFNEKKKFALLKKRMQIMQNLCEIVAINGRPFYYLLDSGFRQLIENDLNELSDHGLAIRLDRNFEELHNYINELANKDRKHIQSCLNGRFIALMLDAASKNNRSILGISAQYFADGKVNIHVLAMAHMEKAHTSEYMQNLVRRCLERTIQCPSRSRHLIHNR